MGSNPIIGTFENAGLLGRIARMRDLIGCERLRTKTHKMTVCLAGIRQVRSLLRRNVAARSVAGDCMG